jgi:hypothetical protein
MKRIYRPVLECFEEAKEYRATHLLWDDLLKERTDLDVTRTDYKMAFYRILQEKYINLYGKAEDGNMGYKLKFIEPTISMSSHNTKHSSIAVSHEESQQIILVINCDDRAKATNEAIIDAVSRFYKGMYGEEVIVQLLPCGFDHTKIKVTIPNMIISLTWTFVSSVEIEPILSPIQ